MAGMHPLLGALLNDSRLNILICVSPSFSEYPRLSGVQTKPKGKPLFGGAP